MNADELTNAASLATVPPMVAGKCDGKRPMGRAMAAAIWAGGMAMLGGCVSVNAPDRPIVIELNINIKQEVIYRLAADAGNTISDNPDLF